MAIAVPAVPISGLNAVMVGTREAPTMNGLLLPALPAAVVTVIGPVVALAGTLVTICVAVAATTTAGA